MFDYVLRKNSRVIEFVGPFYYSGTGVHISKGIGRKAISFIPSANILVFTPQEAKIIGQALIDIAEGIDCTTHPATLSDRRFQWQR